LGTLKENHYAIVSKLTDKHDNYDTVASALAPLFAQLELRLMRLPSENYDFEYDQIVSFGELLSTTLVARYLEATGLSNCWLDARQMIRTDNNFREGRVDWQVSTPHIRQLCNFVVESGQNLIISQGFIGSTAENLTTTLGREGSDYSAAIFAYALDAESVTIWKDVPGLLNADPKFFPDAIKIDQIAYEEAIELSYYGASVIHPKTLQPLQNKNIPLYVKPFYAPDQPGSVINAEKNGEDIPSIIFKTNQILISLFPKDFSFIDIAGLSEIFTIFSQQKIKINLLQNSALSFSICTDYEEQHIVPLIHQLSKNYKVKFNKQVELITIRNYHDTLLNQLMENRELILEQRSRKMLQCVVINRG
jgi:aspartate kinase